MEQLVNDPGTTLNGTISNSVTTLVVASSTGYPTTGNFRILIESELLLVTGVSGTTWTVARGIEGTTAASHTSGAAINQILTAAGVRQVVSDMIYGDPLTPPTTGMFTTSYTSGATAVSFTGDTTSAEQGVILSANSTGGDTDIVAQLFAVPTAPYNFRMRFYLSAYQSEQYPHVGFTWSDSTGTGGYYACFGPSARNDSGRIRYTTYYVGGDGSSNYNGTGQLEQQTWAGWPGRNGLFDIYVSDDGTNRISYAIGTGILADKVQIQSVSNTSLFTPTYVGIFVAPGHNSNGGINPVQMKVIDFTQS